jgi:hypothetical protein
MNTPNDDSRRDFLKTLTVGAGAFLPAAALMAQAGRQGPGPIDVHQHYLAPFTREANSSRWSVAKVLELMDKNGIATVILSGGLTAMRCIPARRAGARWRAS